MKRVRIAELKDTLSAHLRAVEAGAEVEVTDRGRPIARIVPVTERRIALRPPGRSFVSLRERVYSPLPHPSDSTALLREERQGR